MNLTLNGVYWPQIETSSGHFDFTALDALVAASAPGHAKPLLVLGQTPSFASTKAHAANVVATVPRMALWKRYVATVAARYKGALDYEIWPEPSIAANWAGTPQQLARSRLRPRTIIHRQARSAVVVGPAMVMRLKFEQKFMDRFYASKVGGKPVGRSVDAVGIDAYPLQHGTPEDSAALIGTAHKILAAHKVKAPLWNVEITYGVAGAHTTVHPLPGGTQASYVARTFLLNAASGVKRVYWLGWAPIAEVGVQLVQPDLVTPTAREGLRNGAELDDGAERSTRACAPRTHVSTPARWSVTERPAGCTGPLQARRR